MITPTMTVRRLFDLDETQINALADVLIDCVEGGASVSFMHPLTRDGAIINPALLPAVAPAVAASADP
jgi:hypothetical protein